MRIIIGNWKMNKTGREAVKLVSALKKRKLGNEVVLCPPFTSLFLVSKELKNSKIKLGAQNMHYAEDGAFTGEISPRMLKELNCKYVILGHSERRIHFSETDDIINRKVHTALEKKIRPVLCIGENLKERKIGRAKSVVKKQLQNCLRDVKKKDISYFVIAYEPVWAIGTGKTAKPEQVQEMHSFIREFLLKMFGNAARNVRIVYGGSVTPKNIKDLISMKDIDGALVGGASLKADSFAKIVQFF